ncbi:MAG: maltose ABC transporter substrate-binding protein [Propionicimonas sp.]|nr:maltose ABC transporter substrate-binding protein [Propionicimonas sp.]
MRRSIITVGVGALLAATLVACSSPSSTPAPSSTGSTAPTATASSPTAAPANDYTGVTLTVWVDQDRYKAVEAAAKQFQTDTHATIKLVTKDNGKMRDEFTTAVPTGKGPDIMAGAHDWLGGLIQNGVVAPVPLGDKAAAFEKVAVEAFTYNGQTYGVPYAIENIALVRNTKLAATAPATWDDLIAAAKGSKVPVALQVSENGDPYHFYPLQTSFGAPVFQQDDTGSYTAELAMGGDPGHKFAEWLAAQGKAKNLVVSMDGDKAKSAFINGNTPFYITGPWSIADIEKAKLDIAVDPIPSAGGQTAAPFSGVQGFYVSSKSANPIAATDFLVNYIATDEVQTQLFEVGNRTPALTSAATAALADDPIAQGFAAVAKDAVPMPSIPEMSAVWTYWGKTEVEIISGKATDPDKAWDDMIAAIQKDLTK